MADQTEQSVIIEISSNASRESSDDALLYRAVRTKAWQEHPELAFLLRSREQDSKGLSMYTQADCSDRFCIAQLNRCYGEICIKLSDVIAEGLELRLDDAVQYHANIIGLPYSEDGFEEAKKANRLATKLAEKVVEIIRRRVIKANDP
jgi:hypothetical protein